MKNEADYSRYKCPYEHVEKDCGHELKGPEGYENTYGVWCACGFRGPVLILSPEDLKLEKLELVCDECKDERYLLIGCCNGRDCGCMGQPVQITNCKTCNPNGIAEMGDYVKQFDMVEYIGITS